MVHEIWFLIGHYVYGGGMEFFADLGDHFVTHYVVIIVIKLGAANVVAVVAHKVHKARKKEVKADEEHNEVIHDEDIAA